jgi:DNA-binding Lrp family transcriptional regulator
MSARAYVLIEVEAGEIGPVLTALHQLSSIRAADAIIGPYDIVATIEAQDERAIGQLVMDAIHGIAGIKRTTSCVALLHGAATPMHPEPPARARTVG